jgi:hypothetical protein
MRGPTSLAPADQSEGRPLRSGWALLWQQRHVAARECGP